MKNWDVAKVLLEKGYESADQVKDFGYVIPSVLYVKKKVDNNWIYVSVVSVATGMFFNEFLEAVVEVYVGKPKNTRDKGCRPVSTTIVRDPTQLP